MKKISSIILAILMIVSLSIAVAATNGTTEPESVTLDLSKGKITITPTGYTQDVIPETSTDTSTDTSTETSNMMYAMSRNSNSGEVAFTGKYIITGSISNLDTPLTIINNTDEPATFDITLKSAQITAKKWATTVKILGTSAVTVNITNTGKSRISGHSHPPFMIDSNIYALINITNEEGGTFEFSKQIGDDGKLYGSKQDCTFIIDGKLVDENGKEDENGSIEAANVDYTVNQMYTVTIPETVELGSTAKIKAENVVLVKGQQIEVSLTGTSESDSKFKVKSAEGAELEYTIKNENNKEINVSDTVLIANPTNGKTSETTLTFSAPTESKFSGTYKGTVTFTVAVKDEPTV